MIGKNLLICVIFLTIAHIIKAEYDVNGFCSMVKDGTRLGSIDSCQVYYVCRGGLATPQTCSSNQSFDKDVGNCRPSSDVRCYHGSGNPCSGQHNGHVALAGTCGGWVYCQNNVEAGRGECSPGQVFINGICNYGSCKNNANSASVGFKTACSVVPNNLYFGSNLDCAKWQICRNDLLSTGDCKKDMVFDVQIGQCNYFTQAICTRVNGKDIQPDGDGACTTEGVKKASGSKCSSYLICTNGNWIRYECQVGLFYDRLLDSCVSRRTARTSPTCDRCEGSRKAFVNGVDPECRKFYSCQNSLRTGTSECADPASFFNELQQACVRDTPASKSIYQDQNGACYKSSTVIPPPINKPNEEGTNAGNEENNEGNEENNEGNEENNEGNEANNEGNEENNEGNENNNEGDETKLESEEKTD